MRLSAPWPGQHAAWSRRLSHDRPTSLTLLERVRLRNEDAWGRLLHLYRPLVAYWCNNAGVRGQDADDLVQEVFQAVFKSLDEFRRDCAGDTFRGWLRGITRNKIKDYFRRRASEPLAQGGTDATGAVSASFRARAGRRYPGRCSALYRRALDLVRGEFEDRTWTAFWQAAVEDRSPADIAADLGMSPAAVRKAKSRVLHRLRKEIGASSTDRSSPRARRGRGVSPCPPDSDRRRDLRHRAHFSLFLSR